MEIQLRAGPRVRSHAHGRGETVGSPAKSRRPKSSRDRIFRLHTPSSQPFRRVHTSEMTPSLGSRHANRRPTGLPSRSGGEQGNVRSLRIKLGSRGVALVTKACASRLRSKRSTGRRKGRRRHFAGTGAGAAAVLQPLRIATHPNPRTECCGESRLRLGGQGADRERSAHQWAPNLDRGFAATSDLVGRDGPAARNERPRVVELCVLSSSRL